MARWSENITLKCRCTEDTKSRCNSKLSQHYRTTLWHHENASLRQCNEATSNEHGVQKHTSYPHTNATTVLLSLQHTIHNTMYSLIILITKQPRHQNSLSVFETRKACSAQFITSRKNLIMWSVKYPVRKHGNYTENPTNMLIVYCNQDVQLVITGLIPGWQCYRVTIHLCNSFSKL